VEAVSVESSRKSAPSLEPGGCPRCGIRLRQSFKYCPNCAYRLRPGLVHAPPAALPQPSVSQRLVALGGYLAFASMLLLVVFAGFRLFEQPEPVAEESALLITRTRDADCLPLTLASFRPVERGRTYVGLVDLDREILPDTLVVDDDFLICEHEITNDQYYEFLAARARRAGHPLPPRLYPEGWDRLTGDPDVGRIYDQHAGDLPVAGITFRAAREFCAWFWETRLEGDPDRVVDLPTAIEYLRAARGESYDHNFTWGKSLLLPEPGGTAPRRAKVVLDGEPRPVTDPEVGQYDGFYALVGNVAEWAHGSGGPVALGWSHLDYRLPDEDKSPFGPDSWDMWDEDEPRADVGFRLVIRTAPAMPAFVAVEAGEVRHVPPDPDAKIRLFGPRPPSPPDEDEPPPPPAGVEFDRPGRTVKSDFEISTAEITNRQYLHFLVSVSRERAPEEMEEITPQFWAYDSPWNDDAIFLGIWGDPARVATVFGPGSENRPLEGVLVGQVRAYARWVSGQLQRRCRIPTVGEYLRAGRGAATTPYPWGDDPSNALLVCYREDRDEEPRSVALLGRAGARLLGLVGNVAEYVRDEPAGRLLLAGGHYSFPAAICTLDSFIDTDWPLVEYTYLPEPDGDVELDTIHDVTALAGFRLVQETGLP